MAIRATSSVVCPCQCRSSLNRNSNRGTPGRSHQTSPTSCRPRGLCYPGSPKANVQPTCIRVRTPGLPPNEGPNNRPSGHRFASGRKSLPPTRDTHCALVCISVLECASLCLHMLHCASMCITVLQCALVCFSVLRRASVCFNVLLCASVCFTVNQRASLCSIVLQCASVCIAVL